jgi:hypothetical protein
MSVHHRTTPLPTPPPQGGRERTEIAGDERRVDERRVIAFLPFIPAPACAGVNSSGNPGPQSVALGPRFRGDERSELSRADERKKV